MARFVERVEQQFFGKYRGLVTDNKDPDKLGRLKLRIPSVLGEAEEAVTDWAWPCLPFGGLAEQGMAFVPDIGAKVWVEFEEGNPDLPIWVGTFWSRPSNASELPTEAQDVPDTDPKRRVLKTTSGHVLEMSDVPNKEAVRLTHKDGATVTMDEKGSVVIANKEGSHIFLNAEDGEATFVDQHGNNVRMADGGITVTNKDGAVVDLAGSSVQVVAKNVHVRSETVSLGEGAVEPAILGMSFAAMYDSHIHPTAWGPSGPPIPVPMPLSAPTNPAVSKVVKLK